MLVSQRLVRLRPLALFFLLGVLGWSSIACRAAPTLPAPPATLSSGRLTLTLWHSFDDDRRAALESLARDFHATYKDVTVDVVYVGGPDDLAKQMTAAIALGTPPDLVLANRGQIADLARQGGLQALDDYLGDAELGLTREDRSDFLHGALALGRFPDLGGRTYGFPFDQEAFVLFYNADLLRSVNLNQAPRTWDQFGENATTLTQEKQYGWAMRADSDTFEAILTSRGSALLTDAESRALFNERAGLATLKLVASLNEDGAAVLAPSDAQARRAFASGQAAFYMGWMSELDTLQTLRKESKKSFEIGVAPLPQLDPRIPWLLTRGALFGLTTGSGGPDAAARARNAWFFVRWITAPTQSARWVRAADAIPLRASALTFIAPDLPGNSRFRQVATAFEGVLPRLAPHPAHPYIDAVQAEVGALWLGAVQPKADLRALLDDAAARVNSMLAVQP